MNRAELRAKYPIPRFPESWSRARRWAFCVASGVWLAGSLILPNWLVANDSAAFSFSFWGFYLWWWFFPWRWSVAQGKASMDLHRPPV